MLYIHTMFTHLSFFAPLSLKLFLILPQRFNLLSSLFLPLPSLCNFRCKERRRFFCQFSLLRDLTK